MECIKWNVSLWEMLAYAWKSAWLSPTPIPLRARVGVFRLFFGQAWRLARCEKREVAHQKMIVRAQMPELRGEAFIREVRRRAEYELDLVGEMIASQYERLHRARMAAEAGSPSASAE